MLSSSAEVPPASSPHSLSKPIMRIVTIVEKTQKLLSKVKVSGGGRCNVAHACFDTTQLATFYPRGSRQLKSAFHQFSTEDTVEWFQGRGIP